jgi:hypothetical protein
LQDSPLIKGENLVPDIDSDALKVDPGVIAFGEIASSAVVQNAVGDAEGPACQASLSAFRSALTFRNIFTALVAVLAFVTLVSIVFCLVRILASEWDATNTFAAIGAAVTGAGAVFLGKERTKSINVLNDALANVDKYCGAPVKQKLS